MRILHASLQAVRQGEALGLAGDQNMFTQAMMDITGAVLGEDTGARLLAAAAGRERWRLRMGGLLVDVLYVPEQAVIIEVTLPRDRPAIGVSSAPRANNPKSGAEAVPA